MSGEGCHIPESTLRDLGGGDAKAGQRALRLILDAELSHVPINGPTLRPPSVRIATEADEDEILELFRLDHAENAAHVAPFSEQKCRAMIEAATRDNLATIAVVDASDGLAGFTYFQPEQWFFSDQFYVAERMTFVAPGHRASRAGPGLLKYLRFVVDDMARRLGYPVFLIAQVVATQDARRKVAMFGRLLNYAGGVFIYPDPARPSSLS